MPRRPETRRASPARDEALRHAEHTRGAPPEALAILSGLLLTAAHPPGSLSWTAWVALVPLLVAVRGRHPRAAFRIGLIAGLSHYLTLLYWVIVVLAHYGGMSLWVSTGPLLLLATYLALYPAVYALLVSRLPRAFAAFWGAGFWTALEYLRAHLLTGFPWSLLGHTQYASLHWIQVADLCGVYGISFLIAAANGAIYEALFCRETRRQAAFALQTAACVLLLGATWGYGAHRLSPGPSLAPAPNPFRVALVQANVDQAVKWNPAFQMKTLETYATLSRSTRFFRPDLVLWPETALPFFFQEPDPLSERVRELPRELQSALLFGSPAYRRQGNRTRYYNRGYLLGPDASRTQHYDKVHLVPFGEYVPLKRWLFFVSRLVPAAGDFDPGSRLEPLRRGRLSAGVLICFEAIFPSLARRHVQNGANVLVNLTNDAWFGLTSAPYQHLAMSVFRAVENRRYLLRAANTGISAVIDPAGRIRTRSSLFEKAVLTASIRLASGTSTLYTRHGDIFALLLSIASTLRAAWFLKGKMKGK